MSQHAIEDLIETTIQLVDHSALDDARINALIHALLQLQARYDTSLTWFRMHELLVRRAVLQRTPVEVLTDPALQAQAMAAEAPGWLDHDDDAAYIELEDDARVLYRQALPAEYLALPVMFQTVLELSTNAEDTTLFADWYGLLVNGWLDDTFDESDGIPPTLDGLLASPVLLAIRAIAARAGIKRRRGAPEDLVLPKLADAIEPGEVEREFGLRFFLEPSAHPPRYARLTRRRLHSSCGSIPWPPRWSSIGSARRLKPSVGGPHPATCPGSGAGCGMSRAAASSSGSRRNFSSAS